MTDEANNLGIRQADRVERRARQHRAGSHLRLDRRRRERRRRRIRTLLLAAATTAIPTAIKSRPVTLPGVSVSLKDFRVVPAHEAYEDIIKEAAALHGIDANLIRAIMRAESSFNAKTVSPAGAKGLMQIMPALAKELGVTDPFDPRQNIMAGARYLRQLLDAHKGNLALTLASYNAGPGAVARYKGVPPFRETRNYVRKITDYMEDLDD